MARSPRSGGDGVARPSYPESEVEATSMGSGRWDAGGYTLRIEPRRLAQALLPVAGVVLAAGLLLGLPSPAEAQPGSGAEARAPSPEAEPEWEILARHPGDGEQCIVCKQPIEGEAAVEIRYQGRVFHVKESMMDDFRADPEAYFRSMQARSGLFDEAAMPERPMRTGWLAFGVYLVVGLLFGAVCGSVAMGRSRPALPWFFAGLAGNVVALGVLLLTTSAGEGGAVPAGLRKVPSTRAPRPCPHCGATNHPSARACSSCGGALEPEAPAETERVSTA